MKQFLSVLLLSLTFSLAQTKLDIGYMPILPVSQVFVNVGEGSFEEAGIEANLIQFQNGAAIVQALSSGQLDVAYVGIGPAMVAKANDIGIKVVASNIIEQISFIARGDLAAYFEANGSVAEAFSAFASDNGRAAQIATFPSGTVPETVLQFWLANEGVRQDEVEILFMGNAQVQQALLSEAVDAASILEPVVSIALQRLDNARVIASGGELFPDQPGAVLIVRDELISENPQIVQALVDMHIRSTKLLNGDATQAAEHVRPFVGGDRLETSVVIQALENSQGHFVADPSAIQAATRVMHDFQAEVGTLKKEVPLAQLFDVSFYDASTEPKP